MTQRESDFIGLFIITIGLLIGAIAITSLVAARHLLGFGDSSVGLVRWTIGLFFLLLTALIALLNSFFPLLSSWLHRRRHGNLDSFRNVSGVPLVGTFCALVAAVLLPS